jgi:predicted nucleotidyltransferase
LEHWPDLQGIWLFGSLHDGRFGLTSDVDLAVAGLPDDALLSAMALLEPLQDGEIGIDLVRLEDLDLHWQQRIKERGDVLRAVS